jgi:hypothetical protein
MRRVSLLPHRNTWTEIERDAVKVLECYIANRGWHRQGEVVEVPWTVGHIQLWLRKTEARRQGRDYARAVLATLQRMELLRDTGTVLKPRRQPRGPALLVTSATASPFTRAPRKEALEWVVETSASSWSTSGRWPSHLSKATVVEARLSDPLICSPRS